MTESKYYFSIISLTFATLIMTSLTGIFFLFVYFSITGGSTAAIICSCLFGFLLIISLPKYLKFISFLITNRPALILTPKSLIDNINGQEFKWCEIKNISYQTNKGNSVGGYTAVAVIDPDKYIKADPNPFSRMIKRLNTNYFGGTFSIPHNSIKCNSTQLINDLRRFHQTYK